MSKAYKDAGVDIEAGYEVVKRIKGHVKRTHRKGVLGSIGGFGGLFSLPQSYKEPILVSGTDGVGTKLLVALQLGKHRSVGIDLVAMCVNDIATLGAEPLFFLDYFATGKLSPQVTEEVVAGIADGCVLANAALIGGETAELPGMYAPGHYDLAGFCVGVVEKSKMIDGSNISVGDILVGLPSSGLHSNGYSLARKICADLDWSHDYGWGRSLGETLLEPTKIYVAAAQSLVSSFGAKGLAHITGGGLIENIPRMLPEDLGVSIDESTWPKLPIFEFLKERGGLTPEDMRSTFNGGVGFVAALSPERAEEAALHLGGFLIGEVVDSAGITFR
ncbi:MAG: phosphoribosylformylglycinamidine cyclo-ligase [Myxococcota bacterium]|nr:phosphoribosylformylglycinamidine cyclo-ligase [Myxococcota bacterium]